MDKQKIKKIILIVLIAVLVFALFLLYKPFNNSFKASTLHKLNFPVAYGHGELLGFRTLESIYKFGNKTRDYGIIGFDIAEVIKRYLFYKDLVDEEVISLDSKYLEDRKNQLAKVPGVKDFADMAAWLDEAQRQYLLKKIGDKKAFAKSWKRVAEVEAAFDNGMTFEEAARRFSDDETSKSVGGLVGYVSEDALLPEIARSLSNVLLNKPTIITTSTGVYIVKVKNIDSKSTQPKYELYIIYIDFPEATTELMKEISEVSYKMWLRQ